MPSFVVGVWNKTSTEIQVKSCLKAYLKLYYWYINMLMYEKIAQRHTFVGYCDDQLEVGLINLFILHATYFVSYIAITNSTAANVIMSAKGTQMLFL